MTDNSELTKEYIELAKFHSSVDSFDLANTKKINKAANRMIEIAELVALQHGTEKFAELLDHEEVGVRTWASFNLIERMNPNQETVNKALEEIRKIAKSDSLDAFGAELWLKNWNAKNDI